MTSSFRCLAITVAVAAVVALILALVAINNPTVLTHYDPYKVRFWGPSVRGAVVERHVAATLLRCCVFRPPLIFPPAH